MLVPYLIAAILLWSWLRLGGPGLVLLGIADNTVVPLTGRMDVLTIWLAAQHRDLWPYYALMAIAGAVVGGYITYALARKAGTEAIEHRLQQDKAQKVFRRFRRLGFRAIVVSAVLPPPFPMVPVLLAAGALQYPRKKFLGALALGRGIRYCLIAGFGSLYARQITSFFAEYYKPALLILIGLAVTGGIVTLVEYLRSRRRRQESRPRTVSRHRVA